MRLFSKVRTLLARTRSAALLVLCCAAACVPALAATGAYPARAITMIVPFPAGGATDAVARLIATHLGQALGQSIVVENVSGASGAIAAQRVARANPDGYTLLAGTINDVVLAPITNAGAGYQHQSFTTIGEVGDTPFVLVGNPKLRAQDIDGLLAFVRANPGKVNVGIPGVGTLQHIAVAMLQQQEKLAWTTVPYKGAAPLNADLLGGQIELAVITLPSAIPYIKEGKLKSFGVMSLQRDPVYKDLPTINEGRAMKGFSTDAWLGIFAPAAMPAEITSKLEAALRPTLNQPVVREGLAKLGFRATNDASSAALRQRIDRDDARYRQIAASAKLDR